jgi:thioredoxin 1
MAVMVNEETIRQTLAEAELPVVVDFYRDGCVPCRRMSPILSKLETAMEGKVTFVKINTSTNPMVSELYDIEAAPTLVLFRQGKEVARQRGVADMATTTAWIEENI